MDQLAPTISLLFFLKSISLILDLILQIFFKQSLRTSRTTGVAQMSPLSSRQGTGLTHLITAPSLSPPSFPNIFENIVRKDITNQLGANNILTDTTQTTQYMRISTVTHHISTHTFFQPPLLNPLLHIGLPQFFFHVLSPVSRQQCFETDSTETA